MTHSNEEDLTLYYYGEGRRRADLERHLSDCTECAALFREIAGTLAMIAAPEVPERGDQYGLEVWQRIRHRLPEQDGNRFAGFVRFATFAGFGRFAGLGWRSGFAAVGAIAVLVVAAFIAGHTWRQRDASSISAGIANLANPPNRSNPADPAEVRDRILLTSVADHLDRSERMLTDIMNAPERSDISTAQVWAEDLLQTSRLYRQDAIDAGERSVAAMLDDLERSLLEIVHSPSKISAADLEQIRRRIDAAALLFKVRVMSDELRQRETPAGPALPRTSTQKVS